MVQSAGLLSGASRILKKKTAKLKKKKISATRGRERRVRKGEPQEVDRPKPNLEPELDCPSSWLPIEEGI